MLVRYFDLGAFKGGEIAMMRKILKQEPLVSKFEMYAFEAHPGLARHCRWRFFWDRSLKVVPVALGSEETTCSLFLNRNLVGSSIYSKKNNVIPSRRIEVPCTRLSTYIAANLPRDWKDSFNIIKSNIEGAEWNVWHDLASSNLLGAFDLWLGSKEGHDGWSLDLYKIADMHAQADELTRLAKEAGVSFYRFSSFDKHLPNSDIPRILHEALAAREAQRLK